MQEKIEKIIHEWFECYALDMGHGQWSITDEGINKVAGDAAIEINSLVEDIDESRT